MTHLDERQNASDSSAERIMTMRLCSFEKNDGTLSVFISRGYDERVSSGTYSKYAHVHVLF